MDCYENMRRNAIVLPEPPPRGGLYSKIRHAGGSLYFTSGVGCRSGGELVSVGQVGDGATLDDARAAARQCVLNILANIEEEFGDLNRVESVVKMLGFVAGADAFFEQPKVMDAASETLVAVFGAEKGCCARSAIGTNRLPNNQTVEIEMVFIANPEK